MILFCFGTRPEWLKIKPVINLLNRNEYKLLFTGQHQDLLKNIDVDYKITIANAHNRLDQLVIDCLAQFPEGGYESVLVQGDTASAFACALAAFNRQLKIYYLEAGLRSYDRKHPYPEEGYRQMITRLADINFAPTELSKSNLLAERVSGDIYVTGNTALDNLTTLKHKCVYDNKVLVTLHRRENHYWMDLWFEEINKLALSNPELEFILPIHPNPNVYKHRELLKNVKVVNPLPHNELLELLLSCKLVITDSGGLQEESSFFNKKTIVCRKVTERPEAIETGHLHICKSPEDLGNIFCNLIKDYYINAECPYGDGYSSEKVIKHIYNK